ncbi:MAG: SCO1664 family protein [Actinomycetota bacterium]
MTSLATTLEEADLLVEGRLVDASNATLLCTVEDRRCVYKPVAGDRPLWDFPPGSLAGREIAAFEVDRLLGWNIIPLTVWRAEGPAGPGMVQEWCEASTIGDLVNVTPRDEVPIGWRVVVEAQDPSGSAVALAHADTPALQRLSVLDAVINNADRKGGHILMLPDGSIRAVDHGVAFHSENKLRTVLWGWAGEALPTDLARELRSLRDVLTGDVPRIDRWLSEDESRALRRRVAALLDSHHFPEPSEEWPAIPWPVF